MGEQTSRDSRADTHPYLEQLPRQHERYMSPARIPKYLDWAMSGWLNPFLTSVSPKQGEVGFKNMFRAIDYFHCLILSYTASSM